MKNEFFSSNLYVEETVQGVKQGELGELFDCFDKDRDGVASGEELSNLLKSQGIELDSIEVQDLLMDACGKHSTSISKEQFVNIMNKRAKETDAAEEFIEAFRVFDRDGTGVINKGELRHILANLGQNITEEEIDYMLHDADIENDDNIQYEKFIKMLFES